MAITQITGGQTETLTTGLPTVVFGPAQTAAEHQFPISNSVASAASGGYQANPLISSAFQQGMLSPISPKVLAYLLSSHDRQTVFYLALDSLDVTSDKTTVRYYNDPSDDLDKKGQFDGRCMCEVQKAWDDPNPATLRQFFLDERVCNYSKFVSFLTEGLQYGLDAELVPSTKDTGDAGKQVGGTTPSSQQAASANATSAPRVTGRLCWSPALASPAFKISVRTYMTAICGEAPKTTTTPTEFSFPRLGTVQFNPTFRSPAGIFVFLGKLFRERMADRVPPLTSPTMRLVNNEPFLDITQDGGTGCYVSALYDGRTYCVPQAALRTAMVIDILEALKNLSITPSDLNSAFSVRLID